MNITKSLNKILIATILTLFAQQANAQYQGKVYRKADSAVIVEDGKALSSPWTGGMNSVEITMGDLNNDAKKDIVAYDYINNKIFPFINTGLSGDVKYKYEPKYIKNFPNINAYLILKDYNCDNIPDLFYRGIVGFTVEKGSYNANNELTFTPYKGLFYPGTFGPVNAYVATNDIPGIVDMDNDGDLDFMAFDVLGNLMHYYKNMRVENNLACDSIVITEASSCWGGLVQSSFKRTYTLGNICKGFSQNKILTDADEIAEINNLEIITENFNYKLKPKQTRHSGNCILYYDDDGDADKDLLVGSILAPDVQFLLNTGSATNGNIGAQDTQWQSPNNHVYCPSFVAIGGEDIDNDGKQDLQFSPHQEKINNAQSNYNDKLFYYKNIGTSTAPNFSLISDSLLFDEMIDVGAYSYPTFFDYNKDGKLDLFVGSAGTLDTSDFLLKSRISYYKNISDTNKIKFELVSKDFLNLSAKKYKGLYPHFADITGEGKIDLIMGNNKGQVIVYKNMSTSNAVQPNFQWVTDSFNNITVYGNYAAPCMLDVDFDGRKDLILGAQNGQLFYYEDTSSIVNVSNFYYKTGTLGGFSAGGNSYFYGYAAPIYAKSDSTFRNQLIIGTGDGTIEKYDSLQANIYGPYQLVDSFYSQIQTAERAVPAIGDLDGDGDFEMIVGNKLGGLEFYQQVLLLGSKDTFLDVVDSTIDSTVAIVNIIKDKNAFNIYPNPANENLIFETNYGSSDFAIEIYNTNGQLILAEKVKGQKKKYINIEALPNGMYYFKVFDNKYIKTGSVLKK
jgi:Secretion system C-terminal sorting domain/FG-GAP-like repeat